MQRTRDGDEDAARQIVTLYEPEIRRAARIRLTDPKLRQAIDSIDICQSVFGRFFRSVSDGTYDLNEPRDLLRLLTTMIRNRVIDEHRMQKAARRNKDRQAEIDTAQLVDRSPGPKTEAQARELLNEVRMRLTEQERLLADRRTAGDSWEEISDALAEPVDRLRKRLERALDRVRNEINSTGS